MSPSLHVHIVMADPERVLRRDATAHPPVCHGYFLRSAGRRDFLLLLAGLMIALNACVHAAPPSGTSWAERMGRTYLDRHPDSVTYDTGFTSTKWTYEQGLMLTAMLRMESFSGDTAYGGFVTRNLDRYVNDTGGITGYKPADYNLDNCAGGRALIAMYEQTRQVKYRRAADMLRRQLREQPRTSDGGFWHKNIYPHQMWLDGLYMAEPFYATYAGRFGDSSDYRDIVKQFQLIARHTRDSATGLFYHGWDESRKERWADPVTGRSPSFWGRSMGWFAMALVDVIAELPKEQPGRDEMIATARGLARALVQYRDPSRHVWYQVVDQGNRDGNYPEASASCMFVYFLAKGVNDGVLDPSYAAVAQESFRGIIRTFVTEGSRGEVDLHDICRGAGLGGNPYRDGSYEYYSREIRRTNDPKGIGAFLLAAIEVERQKTLRPGDGTGEEGAR